jgi:hypothetical protein
MAGYHTVSQGEHVASIALPLGFTDYRIIWDHPNNADLKSKRENPNVLFPGDLLYIPDRELGQYSRSTDQKHQFVLKRKPLKLRITLAAQYEKPIANTACVLVVDSNSYNLTSDWQGKIEQAIPYTAQSAVLLIPESKEIPSKTLSIPMEIGYLDPVEKISGQQARLTNLGYFSGDINGQASEDLESAVEEFQCDNHLAVDGICGPQTQAKLKQVHGC